MREWSESQMKQQILGKKQTSTAKLSKWTSRNKNAVVEVNKNIICQEVRLNWRKSESQVLELSKLSGDRKYTPQFRK